MLTGAAIGKFLIKLTALKIFDHNTNQVNLKKQPHPEEPGTGTGMGRGTGLYLGGTGAIKVPFRNLGG
jgi:hypothetical protein